MRSRSSDEQQKSPAFRALMVLDAIGKHGPVSLSQLCAILPIPRTAIWRATATLREFGWIRMRPSQQIFELSGQFDTDLADAHFAHPASDAAAQEIARLKAAGKADIDAGVFISPGKFALIESTRADADIGNQISLTHDPFALSVQAAMPPAVLLRHLRAFQRSAEQADVDLIDSGQHARVIIDLKQQQKEGTAMVPHSITIAEEVIYFDIGSDGVR